MKNRIFATPIFNKILKKTSHNEKIEIQKLIQTLRKKLTGQPLGVDWLFEKRIVSSKRIYYVSFFKYKNKILFVEYGNKKQQKETIKEIKKNKEIYLDFLHNLK